MTVADIKEYIDERTKFLEQTDRILIDSNFYLLVLSRINSMLDELKENNK